MPDRDNARLIGVGEVAAKLQVNKKTAARWADEGKLPHIRTPGGHRRFYEDEIDELIKASYRPATRPLFE